MLVTCLTRPAGRPRDGEPLAAQDEIWRELPNQKKSALASDIGKGHRENV